MPRLLLGALIAGLTLVLPACRNALRQSHPVAEPLKIGAAERDITPPVGYRMAGYYDERCATGTHDPLKAKALVFQQGRVQIGFVFCDLLGVPLSVSANARQLASTRTGIPMSHLVIGATHSHTGPLFDDVRSTYFHKLAVARFGKDPHETVDYAAFLTEQVAQALVDACSRLRAATLSLGTAEVPGASFNRRYWMKDGKVRFNPGRLNPDIVRAAGPADPSLGMLLATDAETHQPFAGATIFALHSDTVGGTEFSADYEYFLEQTLRRRFGPSYISLFGAGTCGDLNHIDVSRQDPLKGFQLAERIGTTLANQVIAAAPALQAIRQPRVAARSRTLQVDLQTVTREQLAEARSKIDKIGDSKTDFFTKVVTVKNLDLAQRGPRWPMEVQAFRIDNETAIVCLPGEIFVELGLAIKKASPFPQTFVISICNDRPGYVPTRKAFAEGSYEVVNSRVAPGTGEVLVRTAIELLEELKHPSSASEVPGAARVRGLAP